MAISDKMVGQLEKRVQYKQDKKIPFLININDGRLIPNNPITIADADYRPYTGPLNATLPQRMAYISQAVGGVRRVIASTPLIDLEAFDVSKASRDELVAFAFDSYGVTLDGQIHLTTLRRQVKDIADRMAQSLEAQGETLA